VEIILEYKSGRESMAASTLRASLRRWSLRLALKAPCTATNTITIIRADIANTITISISVKPDFFDGGIIDIGSI